MPAITNIATTTNANTTEPAAASVDAAGSAAGDSIGAVSGGSGMFVDAAVVEGAAAAPAVVVGADVVVGVV